MRVAVLVLFVVLSASVEAAMTPVEIKRDYGDAVVTISTYSAAEDAVGLGSGFIIDPSGVIVTCYHVIDGAYPAVVKLLNGASFHDIWVLGCDSANDVAVIRVKGRGLPAVKLGDSDDVEVGERVVVIGNPKGLENTVSDGLLSGVREVEGCNILQISAPISPGSSGGPVFNSSGHVIGIAAATLRDGQNLNFCVPIKHARLYTEAEPNLTLEDFSRGVRGMGPRPTGADTVSGQHAFLMACVDPMIDFCGTPWREARASDRASEVVARGGTPAGYTLAMVTAHLFAKEKMLSVKSRLAKLPAPNPNLGRVREAFLDAAQRAADGYDILARGSGSNSQYAIMAGAFEAKSALQPMRDAFTPGGAIELLARAYLEDGRTPSDTAMSLPSAFDRLPAAFITSVGELAMQDSALSRLRVVVESARVKQFGFYVSEYLPGVVVESTATGTPAQRAGLRADDVIVAVSDTLPIRSRWDWLTFVAHQPVGNAFSMDILRAGQRVRLSGKLDHRPH
jgi:S1-C subfamily serine protease